MIGEGFHPPFVDCFDLVVIVGCAAVLALAALFARWRWGPV